MVITSLDNRTVKDIIRLKDKKYRDASGKYLIEGYRAVRDSLPYLLDAEIFFSQSFAETDEVKSFSESLRTTVVSDAVMKKISDTQSSQGVICVSKIKIPTATYDSNFALLLDRIRDPGNMGTILRSALATGFSDIYCVNCVDVYNPKVVRSAMSAVAKVNVYNADYNVVNDLKSNGYTLLAADMHGDNVFSNDVVANKICIAVGNEANGLSEKLLKMSDKVLSLPMESLESLNAGVSAAVLMYQLRYGRR